MKEISPHSRLAAALLAGFLGWSGAHRFYVGKTGTGILMLCTAGGLGIWATVDLILIVVGAFKDRQGRLLLEWTPRPAEVAPPAHPGLNEHVDRIEGRLTELQGVLIDMVERLDRPGSGSLG